MRRLIIPLCLISFAQIAGANEHETNTLYEALLTEGVKLSDGTVINLPPCTLADEASPEDQEQTVQEVAGRIPYAEFVRDSRTARFRLQLKSVKDSKGDRTGQTVDVWFVAYGTLEAIEENALLDELAELNREQADQTDENQSLTEEQLAARDIPPVVDEEALVQRYVSFDGSLLNKVRISGVTRSLLSRGEKSTLAATALDERFAGDPEFPNQWRPLQRNDLGELEIGPAHRYSGFGGYIKVTELIAPEGALLVEMHVAFDEPQGWFGGANLLRTKLPLVVQDNVRAFRKKLKDLAKAKLLE